jgi:hypothetical protein
MNRATPVPALIALSLLTAACASGPPAEAAPAAVGTEADPELIESFRLKDEERGS